MPAEIARQTGLDYSTGKKLLKGEPISTNKLEHCPFPDELIRWYADDCSKVGVPRRVGDRDGVLAAGFPSDITLSAQNKAPWLIGLTIHGAAEFDDLAVWCIDSTVDGSVRIANAIDLGHEHALLAVLIYEANCAAITFWARACTSYLSCAVTCRALNHSTFLAKLHSLLFGLDLDH
ncbi:hypothetical protein ACWPKS_09570 [Coraliomargarita sp. W4R72]